MLWSRPLTFSIECNSYLSLTNFVTSQLTLEHPTCRLKYEFLHVLLGAMIAQSV